MLLYLFLGVNFSILSFFGSYFSGNKIKKSFFSTFLPIFGILVLWVITAFRASTIGNDTSGYIRIFNEIRDSGLETNSRIEMGFKIICLGISKITPDPHHFLIIISSLFYGLVTIYIFKFSKNKPFSVVLLYCLCFSLFISMIRQSLAMIVILFAYELLKKKKTILFLVLVTLATTIHITAIFALLLLLYRFIKCPPRLVLIVILLLLALINATGISSNLIISFLSRFNLLYYERYFTSVYASGGFLAVSYEFLRALCIFALVYATYRNSPKGSEGNLIIYNSILMCLFCSFGFLMNLSTRISEYFLLISVVELPNAIELSKSGNKKILVLSICLLFIAYFTFAIYYRPEWNHLYPYEFWK